jgi:hypothetical protein
MYIYQPNHNQGSNEMKLLLLPAVFLLLSSNSLHALSIDEGDCKENKECIRAFTELKIESIELKKISQNLASLALGVIAGHTEAGGQIEGSDFTKAFKKAQKAWAYYVEKECILDTVTYPDFNEGYAQKFYALCLTDMVKARQVFIKVKYSGFSIQCDDCKYERGLE